MAHAIEQEGYVIKHAPWHGVQPPMKENYRHPLNGSFRTEPEERKFNVSAYLGKGNNVYLSSEGKGVTKEMMLTAFKQVATLFGWELTGTLIDA